jgi:hypothetical protein
VHRFFAWRKLDVYEHLLDVYAHTQTHTHTQNTHTHTHTHTHTEHAGSYDAAALPIRVAGGWHGRQQRWRLISGLVPVRKSFSAGNAGKSAGNAGNVTTKLQLACFRFTCPPPPYFFWGFVRPPPVHVI